MPRSPTSDENAELAVTLFNARQTETGRSVDDAWLTFAELLMTCQVWQKSGWEDLFGQPVLQDSNNYKLRSDKTPNKALEESTIIGDYIAQKLGVIRQDLCASLGTFIKHLGIQPNNPRGHAFRSLSANLLAKYGDSTLTVEEEQDPHQLFPGFPFHLRSENARIDLVVSRQKIIVALCSTRWTYRHDRVDMLEEAVNYMGAARRMNPNCRFFGITAEINPARLCKVINQTTPVERTAAIERLVHLHKPLATTVIGHNGDLQHMWDLAEWVKDSFNWT